LPNSAESSRRFYTFETTSYNFSVNISSGLANALALRILNFDVFEIGVLTSTKIFSYALSQLPGVFFPDSVRRNRKLIWNIGGALNRIGLSLSILSVFTTHPISFQYLLGLTAVTQFAGGLAGVAAGDLLGDLVSLEEAPSFWSRINRLIYVSTILSLLTGSLVFLAVRNLLEAYILVYSVALASALFSTVMLLMIKDPGPSNFNGFSKIGYLRRGVYNRISVVSFSNDTYKYLALQLLFNYSVNLPAPFWDYLVLNILGGNEIIILVKNMGGLLAKFFSIEVWKKNLLKNGSNHTLSLGMASTSLVPVAYIVAPSAWMTILAEAYSGFAWSSLDLTNAMYTFYLTPSEQRPAYISVLSLSSNLIASVASFTGSLIAGITGSIYPPFIISSIMRIASSGITHKLAPEINHNRSKMDKG